MTTAISHLVHEPDWLMLRCQSPEVCAESIQSILKTLENNERWVYAIRGEALRLFDERKLYLLFADPAGDECSCTFRWLQVYLPDSARYCQEALVSRQKLHDTIPLEVAANVTRTNLRLLEGTSESVRRLPEVQEAAQTMSEKAFKSKLNKDYAQHVESRRKLVFILEDSAADAIEAVLDEVGEIWNLETRSGQLEFLVNDWRDGGRKDDENDGTEEMYGAGRMDRAVQPEAHPSNQGTERVEIETTLPL